MARIGFISVEFDLTRDGGKKQIFSSSHQPVAIGLSEPGGLRHSPAMAGSAL